MTEAETFAAKLRTAIAVRSFWAGHKAALEGKLVGACPWCRGPRRLAWLRGHWFGSREA